MTWNELVYGLGDILAASFKVLPALANLPNILFTVIIFGGLVYWIMELKKYKVDAERTGGIE